MDVGGEFDEWAFEGRDKDMEKRHWHTAKFAVDRMPIEAGDTVVDLGTGSGYIPRFLSEKFNDISIYGLDGSSEMLKKAKYHTEDKKIGFLRGNFEIIPFLDNCVNHVFSMEAFYYAENPYKTLKEIRRILNPGGTFFCAVDYFKENEYSHHWQDSISIDMTLWSSKEYREAFRNSGFYVAEQDNISDLDIEIPPEDAFPLDNWENRENMFERYRKYGTLLTVGVAP